MTMCNEKCNGTQEPNVRCNCGNAINLAASSRDSVAEAEKRRNWTTDWHSPIYFNGYLRLQLPCPAVMLTLHGCTLVALTYFLAGAFLAPLRLLSSLSAASVALLPLAAGRALRLFSSISWERPLISRVRVVVAFLRLVRLLSSVAPFLLMRR